MRITGRRLAGWIFFCAATGLAGLAVAAAASPKASPAASSLPKPTRYVTDNAGVLPADRANALNEKLAAFERATSDQVLVYTEKKVPEGTTLEELGARSIREWGPGQKGKSNGLIFFIFPDDRKMRVEVGYGLEGAIPDARSHRITDEIVKPYFRQGDFAGGIEAGVDALLAAARGEPFAGTGKTVAESSGPAHRSVPVTKLPFAVVPIGCVAILALLTFAVILARRENSRAARHRFMTGGSHSSSSSSSFFSSSGSSSSDSSSSSSSSDFSGGGGDGGGGGSSDSW